MPIHRKSTARGGFTLLGLLLVLAIIAILMGHYFTGPSGTPEDGLYQTSMDKSKNVACEANRMVLRTHLQSWEVMHSSETPSIEALRQANVSIPECPQHGKYTIGPKGEIYCSIHNPPPAAETDTPAPAAGAAVPRAPSPVSENNPPTALGLRAIQQARDLAAPKR